MSASLPTDIELQRMEAASDWLIRLNDAPRDEELVAEWLRWCDEDAGNLRAFQHAQTVWHAAAPNARAPARSFSRHWLAAATILLAAGVGVWFLLARDPTPAVQSYATGIAGLGTGVLPDGSKVELGARSRISTRYTAELRSVTVDAGEAYFTVEKDPSRPFVVDAGTVRITALGTAFNVRRGDDRVVVAVSEGRVRIDAIGESQQPVPSLSAGKQAVFIPKAERMSIAPIEAADTASWRQGVLKYVNEPLSAVATDLNRYSSKPIVIIGSGIGELPFTGAVFSDRIPAALQGFEDVFPLKVVDRGDRIELAAR